MKTGMAITESDELCHDAVLKDIESGSQTLMDIQWLLYLCCDSVVAMVTGYQEELGSVWKENKDGSDRARVLAISVSFGHFPEC